METANGKYAMIWKAYPDYGLIGNAELRFVEYSWGTIHSRNGNNGNAKVNINESGDNRFHYIFVC
ncbi:MAG: hypothetical protein WA913_14750 [Pricia sp.]